MDIPFVGILVQIAVFYVSRRVNLEGFCGLAGLNGEMAHIEVRPIRCRDHVSKREVRHRCCLVLWGLSPGVVCYVRRFGGIRICV